MSRVRTIAKNTSILLVSQIITYVIGFFITIYTAPYLGPTAFGILNIALALTAILVVFTDLGLATLTVREVSRDKSFTDKYTGNVAVLKVILASLTFILAVVLANVFPYSELAKTVIYIITGSMILNAFSGIFYPIFQSYQKMEYQSIAAVLNSSLMLIGTFLLIFNGLSVIYFAWLYLIANAVGFIYITVIYIQKFHFPHFEIDIDFWKSIMKMALPLSLVSIFALIAFRVDTVLLSILKGATVVGWYSASYRLLEVFLFVPGVFTTALFPVFSKLHISSQETLKLYYHKSFKYLAVLSLPVAVGISILAPQIILLLYKSAYTPSIIILQILIWTIPITFLNYIFGTILPAMNRQNVLLKVTLLSMIFNIVLNYLLIPTYSYLAAATLTVATELFVFILCFFVLYQTFQKVKLQHVFIKPAMASLVMALFLLYFKLNLFLEIIIGAIIYFAVLFALREFSDDDWGILREIFGMKQD